jgi:hypothetical protein
MRRRCKSRKVATAYYCQADGSCTEQRVCSIRSTARRAFGVFATGALPPPPSSSRSSPPSWGAARRARATRGLRLACPLRPDPRYNDSYTGTFAVVCCRYGKSGDQRNSAATAAAPCRVPGCTNMTHYFCAACTLRLMVGMSERRAVPTAIPAFYRLKSF